MGCSDFDKLGETQTPFNAPTLRHFESHPTSAEAENESSSNLSVYTKEFRENQASAAAKGD